MFDFCPCNHGKKMKEKESMNTINNRSNVTNVNFGMKFTPRAQEIIKKNAGQLMGETLYDFYGNMKPSNYIAKIKGLVNHKKTNDLTLDIAELENGRFRSEASFSKGTALKKSLSRVQSYSANITDVISTISLKLLEVVKQNLKKDYESAKEVNNKAKALLKLSKRKEIKSRFIEGSAKFIPELNMPLERIQGMVLSAPKRFSFKIVKNGNEKAKLFAATKKYPVFVEYEPFPLSFLNGKRNAPVDPNKIVSEVIGGTHKESIEYFEKTVLKNFNTEGDKLIKAKEKLKALFDKPKGLNFSETTKELLLESPDVTSAQISEFIKLAKRESAKSLVLNLRNIGGFTYDAYITGYGYIKNFGYHGNLKSTINATLNVMKEIETLEKLANDTANNSRLREQKNAMIGELLKTEGFKNKFVGSSASIILEKVNSFDFEPLKALVDNTEGFTFKLEKNFAGVAHKDYPEAGFVSISGHKIKDLTLETLNTIKDVELKWNHNNNLKIKNTRETLENIFANS